MSKEILFSPDKRDEEWLKSVGIEISNQMGTSYSDKQGDVINWQYYNEVTSPDIYDYLTRVGQNVLPAKWRHIGIQRNKINYLVQRQQQRLFDWTVILSDRDSLSTKHEAMGKMVFGKLLAKAKERSYQLNVTIRQMQQKKEMLAQQLQQLQGAMNQEGIPPEQVAQLQMQAQQMESIMPELEEQLNLVIDELNEQHLLTSEEINGLKQYSRYQYRDVKEIVAQKVMKRLIRDLKIKKKSAKSFISKAVSGKQFYFVDHVKGKKDPIFEPISELKVYYPVNTANEWVHEGQWVAIEEVLPFDAVKKKYAITKGWTDEVEKALKEGVSAQSDNSKGFVNTEEGISTDEGSDKIRNTAIDVHGYFGNYIDRSVGINEKRIWFKSSRKVVAKISPNPYDPTKTITHFIDGNKTIIDPDEYVYRKIDGQEYYVNKKYKDIKHLVSNTEKLKKTDKREERYIDDLYQITILNNKYPVDFKLKDVQVRRVDCPSEVYLPVIGPNYSDITNRPYSLIRSTIALQDIYNIISYKKELLIALSGVKGQIIDLSQKPANMSREEQAYHKKMGALYISTVGANGRPINSTFNQWKDYDDTMSPTIVNMDQMLMAIDLMVHKTMGVNPQALGIIENNQLVGTMDRANEQAELIASSLFFEHDQVLEEALNVLINIAAKYSYINGDVINIIDDHDMGNEIVKLQNNMLANADYRYIIANNNKDDIKMKELKQIAINQGLNGSLPFQYALTLYTVDSVKELQLKYKEFTELAEKMRSEQAQAMAGAEFDKEAQLVKFAKDYDMTALQETNKIKMLELEMKKFELQLKERDIMMKNSIAEKKIASDEQTKMADIAAEREIESEYLVEQNRVAQVQEEFQKIELELEALKLALDGMLRKKEDTTYREVEIKKATAKKKERNTV